MSQPIRTASVLLLFCGVIAMPPAAAHSDPDITLYVASGGKDHGSCNDPARPCRSISYALRYVGKGGQIRVAEGSYEIEDPEDIFYVVSGDVDVVGGYRQGDDFRGRSATTSVLTGVPLQYRDALNARGFHVITDRKGIEKSTSAKVGRLLALHSQLKSGAAATPCAGGEAAGLPCDSVDLLSHLALSDISTRPAAAADVWGFVDLNSNREYAIVGVNTGSAVIDVTDPEAPAEVGFIDGQNTTWRDIKVYQSFDAAAMRWKSYAYVTSDAANDGLVIIDLTGLPQAVGRIAYAGDFNSAHNIYATNTDYSTGIALTDAVPGLIVAGPNRGAGQYRAYSLADPAAPELLAGTAATQYMHDASSIVLTDARKDTQCANVGPHCEVLLDFNENSVDIWDITNPGSPALLSSTGYPNSGYVHSGSWSEDKQYMFVHDELDERQSGLPTTLRVFSLANLLAPTLAGTWSGTTNAIDHNGFVRGNRYYMSNYTRGLTVLDISNPGQPSEIGSLDTYPGIDNSSFNGAWGVYPFFYSGTLAISDINSGLYLARDRTLDVAQGRLSFARPSYAAVEGQQADLLVQRSVGSSGAVSVDFEILAATANSADYLVNAGRLTWIDGDSSDRSIVMMPASDGIAEGLERLIVRLVSPAGGATLGSRNTASLYLSDPGAAAEIRFADASIDAAESGFGKAVIVLQRTGSAIGAATVDYSIGAGDAIPGSDFQGSTAGTVSWADGDADPKSLVFDIEDDGVGEDAEFFEVSLNNSSGATLAGTTARVNIGSRTAAAVTPPNPTPAGKGGGALGLLWLAVLGLLAALSRLNRKGVA